MILNIYGLTHQDINELKKYKKIVLTQPYGKTEKDKVEFYAKCIGGYNVDDVVIKSHPRETTDYSNYFPNAYFFGKQIPFQLLEMCGVKFKEIYTINSSSLFEGRNGIILHKLKIDEI